MAVASARTLADLRLLDVRVNHVSMADALEAVDAFVRVGGHHQVVTLDSSMCVLARHDSHLRRIVAGADLVTPDSVGVLWACKRAGAPLPERVSGVEMVENLCRLSSKRGYRLYFLGAAPGIAAAAADRMVSYYPGCRIVGCRDGFFSPAEEPDIADRIRAASPDILCVALGIPKQEKWIDRNRHSLGVPVLIGVGGTFDVLSGSVRRAPAWVQRLNLEWLYRLARNPRKIRKAFTLPQFVLMVLRSR